MTFRIKAQEQQKESDDLLFCCTYIYEQVALAKRHLKLLNISSTLSNEILLCATHLLNLQKKYTTGIKTYSYLVFLHIKHNRNNKRKQKNFSLDMWNTSNYILWWRKTTQK
jgi:hypothetical protein